MIIVCPWCGKRDVGEFTYKGDGMVKRPVMTETALEPFEAYVYDRGNPAGSHKEIWQHSGGCRSHVLVERNTLTHKVLSCDPVGPWASSGLEGGR